MATLVLSAAGAAVGGGLGGSFLGLSSMVLGRAVGATVGSMIDQRLLGAGAASVETARIDRVRVMGSSEGASLPRCFGRMRVPGQLIWSSRFREDVTTHRGGGKGGGRGRTVREYGYSISLAVALCEGVVTRLGRIWVDGQPISQSGLTLRLHHGTEDQEPDPLIEALEGAGRAPAYRGTAYVVIEDLDLGPYGSRIPQFNFEVFRRPDVGGTELPRPPSVDMRAVALVPGTGEYSLATEPIYLVHGRGQSVVANVNNDRGEPDLVVSLDQLSDDVPGCESVSLVVSWFGDDLRVGRCRLYPAVEQKEQDGAPMPWRVSGVGRGSARAVSRIDERPLFGGTPADGAVLQAIRDMKSRGLAVMFYPFILMDILSDNALENPWTPGTAQPPVPWRGRITLDRAPGIIGSVDTPPAAASQVAAFFGNAAPSDFSLASGEVVYSGPPEWSYRRFILHYAHLCALSGGVEAFCVGSEMRGLTQIRDSATGYPAVRELARLAEEVKAILGPSVKVSYAADWSEYFGHRPDDGTGDVIFHLDELWAHPAIDFIGIDNYMPLSDWRDGVDHRDAGAGSIYDLGYLTGNVAGGEGYDWYYPDGGARDTQDRVSIEDGAYGEDWIFRYKDILGWWSNVHRNRIGGIRVAEQTGWIPQSKPIWFTELGCPAVDKGTNQPNVFFDPKSSESFLPYYSSGGRDDFIQHRYLQAMYRHWGDPAKNPVSSIYGAAMVDMRRAHVWAWDARPWPDFPNRLDVWIDGGNYGLGHWLNGRITRPALADVVAELCSRAGIDAVDVGGLTGGVTGYAVSGPETARQSIQPLMLAFAFDGFAIGPSLVFAIRQSERAVRLEAGRLAVGRSEGSLVRTRETANDLPGRLALSHVHADLDYQAAAAEAVDPGSLQPTTVQSSLPIALSAGEAAAIVERWLDDARAAQEVLTFQLPPSALSLTAGDVVELVEAGQRETFRVDRIEDGPARAVTAVKVEASRVRRSPERPLGIAMPSVRAAAPVHAVFLDLPLMSGDEVPHAPHLAVSRRPWAGPVAVYSSAQGTGFSFDREIARPAVLGTSIEPLAAAEAGLWSRDSLVVRLDWGSLLSRSRADVLAGANAAALRHGGGGDWEVLQFASARLVAPLTYELTELLRGQAGTDGVMPPSWPVGTDFVLLDEAVGQVPIPPAARGVERRYRLGAASSGYDHPSYVEVAAAFEGVGERPYRPSHLRAVPGEDGAIRFTWIRRTRIGGDDWRAVAPPLGEERLEFHCRLLAGGALLREAEVGEEAFTYTAVNRQQDGSAAQLTLEVAQMSATFGAGPYARLMLEPPPLPPE